MKWGKAAQKAPEPTTNTTPTAEADKPTAPQQPKAVAAPATPAQPAGDAKVKKVGWLKRGAAAQREYVREEARAEARREQQGSMWRFFISAGEETNVTFLDGELIQSGEFAGMLDLFSTMEHTIRHDGKWTNFVCVAENEPCPLCDMDNKSEFSTFFTVLDHTERMSRDGKKIYRDEPKLFVAKKKVLAKLQKQASKRGGLTGCTFTVGRTGDKEPRTGDEIEFVEKRSLDELKKIYGDKVKVPDYSAEIPYRTAHELKLLGLGKPSGPAIGSQMVGSSADLENELAAGS